MFYSKGRILSAGQLRSLADHKYSSVSSSLLDPLLQPWWNYLVSATPPWLAPNLITVTGLAVNIATSLLLVWFTPDARAEPPRWACLLCALGLFVYQSLDAIDGKQARITKTSSPLGELFDHGCDAVSTVFLVLSATLTVRLGFYPHLMFLLCFTGMTSFYCAHWKTYVTGTLRFGKIDATEAQTIIMLIHVISAAFGPSVWWGNIPYVDLPFILIFGTLTLILSNMFVAVSLIEICSGGGVGKNGSSVAGTSVLSPAIPFALAVLPGYVIYWKSVEGVYETHPALYVLAFGMCCAKVTNRLVVAHMTKTEIDYFDSALVGPAMLFFNQYFDTFLPEYPVLWACLVWIVVDLLVYSGQVCREICDHLGIRLFRIPTPATVEATPLRRGMFGVLWSPATKMARPRADAVTENPEADGILLDTTKDPITLDSL